MKQRVIAVDVDGVVAELHEEWLARYNRDHRDNLTREKLTTWQMHDFVKPGVGVGIYSYLSQPDLYDHVTPVPGALEGVRQLREMGRVVFVSSCASGTEPAKVLWLKRHGFLPDTITQPDWYACSDKSLIDADVLVDDYDRNCTEFTARDPERQAVLFHRPWNSRFNATAHISRAYDWPWVVAHVRQILAWAAVAHPRIALCGYSRVGKDTAAKGLYPLGFEQRAFGNVIKAQLDDLCEQHLGFSAFTEEDSEKKVIRQVLEHWGEANYANITSEFFNNLPERCVNTKLVRVREAEEWKRRDGILLEVRHPHAQPATQWEADRLEELRASGLVDGVLHNDGSAAELQAKVAALAQGDWSGVERTSARRQS